MRIKTAVIGCGGISTWHLAGWIRIPEVTIVALCDLDRNAAEARRQAYAPEARVYTSIEALLASESIDLLDVVTPPALHTEHCLAAARAGVHIVCQKPLCDTLSAARALVAALADYPRRCGVHENHRYRPWFRTVLARHAAAAFGTLQSIHLLQHDPEPPPEPFKRQAAHGVLLEYGVHLVDLTRALLGDPQAVSARIHRLNPAVHGDSLAHVTLHYGGATALIDIAWKAGGLQQGGALILGDAGEAWYEGRMTRGDSARLRLIERGALVLDEPRSPTAEYGEAFYLLEREFVDGLVTGQPFTQTLSDHLRTLEATFGAYAAARAQAVVPLR